RCSQRNASTSSKSSLRRRKRKHRKPYESRTQKNLHADAPKARPADRAAVSADGSEARGESAGRRPLAVRAEGGWLSRDRLPERRRRRDSVEGGAAARPLFSR